MARLTAPSGVVVVGAPRHSLRDVYHLFLRARWSAAIAGIAVVWLALNAAFACLYALTGGVSGARAGSLWDAFCFSVQTMGTIGYGAMVPTSVAANAVVAAESVTSLVVTAVATGLVFAKFSRSTPRVRFSKHVAVGPMNGVPTLMLRIGNQRGNSILEATIRVALIRTERLAEGQSFYRMVDLRLTRDRSPAMQRSWTALHPIEPGSSPLWGASPESLERDEAELIVTVVGVDETSLQPVHARARYVHGDFVWGARHADILSEDEADNVVLDVRRFDDVEPTRPIEGFPYPREASAA